MNASNIFNEHGTINNPITAILARQFETMAKQLGYKPGTKKFLSSQADFFNGVVAVCDIIKNEGVKPEEQKTSASPLIFFSIMRGDRISEVITKLEEKGSEEGINKRKTFTVGYYQKGKQGKQFENYDSREKAQERRRQLEIREDIEAHWLEK